MTEEKPEAKPDPAPAEPLPPTVTALKAELADARKALGDGQAWAKAEIERLTRELAAMKQALERADNEEKQSKEWY